MKQTLMLSAALALGSLSGAAIAAESDNALIERGHYISTASDCVACHTTEGGAEFAGGKAIETPLGEIFAPNITPSKTGIGAYTYEQFDAAVREGIRADGAHLYPAMPYTAYAKITDEDMKALYAYFMQGVEPVEQASPQSELPFPFNIRLSMLGWNLLFLDGKPYEADSSQSDQWNRGAYLGEALAHCSTCHTPRNAMMAEDRSKLLGGASLGTWYAPNITADVNSGIGNWSEAEIISYLKSGHADGKSQAAGPMAEAIAHSLQHLHDEDLQALAVWLKSVPAVSDAADTQPADSHGQALADPDAVLMEPLPEDMADMSGAQLYEAACSSCHQADGTGAGGLPSLVNNTVLGRSNTDNLVMAILDGVKYRNEIKASYGVDMLAFRNELSDAQIARVANYTLENFGRAEVANISAAEVGVLRNGGPASNLLPMARWGMGIAAGVIVLLLLVWVVRRRAK